MTDPRFAPTTPGDGDRNEDPVEGPRDPAFTDPGLRPPDGTHTAAIQGAAAGGAMGGNAGYAGGLLTGSEDQIGMADIPDADDDTDAGAVKGPHAGA